MQIPIVKMRVIWPGTHLKNSASKINTTENRNDMNSKGPKV
jgi:hypothetical protein